MPTLLKKEPITTKITWEEHPPFQGNKSVLLEMQVTRPVNNHRPRTAFQGVMFRRAVPNLCPQRRQMLATVMELAGMKRLTIRPAYSTDPDPYHQKARLDHGAPKMW